jgi:hypothetical protein
MSYATPTEDELAAVARIKAALSAPPVVLSPRITDTCILRFYRGFKLKEDVALNQLLQHQKWRTDNLVDEVQGMTDKFVRPLTSGLTAIGMFDRNGRPASFIYVHKHNPSTRDMEEIKLFIIYILESLVRAAKPEEERFIIVFDLSRFSLACMDYEVVKSLLNILQTNYTDTLETLYIVDAPFLFSACWSIIRPWIDPITVAKVLFIKRAQLTDFFEPGVIPAESEMNSKAGSSKSTATRTRESASEK